MANRKKLIEEIIASFHAMRNTLHAKMMQAGRKDCITHSQIVVLDIIGQHRNIGIKEISEKLNISSSAATQLVDKLAENGYVARRPDTEDRRALQLAISANGKRHMAGLKQKRMKAVTALFSILNDKELERYLVLHKKILFPR